ncbi:MAG: hypothetical protein H6707_15350 [Deltaproteobacteria bacterium]|nr:hypothetical protein [Deltaproteobacteria bacterium]
MKTKFSTVLVLALVLQGCKANKADTSPGTIGGKVRDVNGTPVGGVIVKAGALSATSMTDGSYVFAAVPPQDRLVINYTKTGYVLTSRVVRVRPSTTITVDATIAAHQQPTDVDAASGGRVDATSGAMVELPANALVDAQGKAYAGTAKVALTAFDTTSEAGQKAFPGDFAGVAKSGETIPLLSYGYIDVTVTDDAGATLQLAAGKSATIVIPIPASLRADAPTTMPLWYFDPQDGQWHEEGSGTRVGDGYQYTIGHFSLWNSDVGYDRSYVVGRVVDCRNRPVFGATVICKGISPRNCWTSGERSTDRQGRFPADDDPWGFKAAGVAVDADSTFSIQAISALGSSVPKVLTARPVGQVLEVGDLCVCESGPCGATTNDGGTPPVDGSTPLSGNYTFRIHSVVDSCDPNPGELSGAADVVITGDKLSLRLQFPGEPQPMAFSGSVGASGWSAARSFEESYDGCLDSVTVQLSGTSDIRANSFAGDFHYREIINGDGCASPQDCKADGQVLFTRK